MHKDKQHSAHFGTQIGGGEGDSGRGSWSKEVKIVNKLNNTIALTQTVCQTMQRLLCCPVALVEYTLL